MVTVAKLIRKIKCPRHYLLRPGCEPFEMEPIPGRRNLDPGVVRKYKVRTMLPKRDKFGNRIPKWSSYYQPEVTCAFAIEHIYDPLNPICKFQCKGRCLRGQGTVNERGIKRLNG